MRVPCPDTNLNQQKEFLDNWGNLNRNWISDHNKNYNYARCDNGTMVM